MKTPIDFYFDFSSPYSYIASEWVEALAARHGRTVRWHAILLGATFQAAELRSPVAYPIKRDYSLRDFRRSARFEGLPYVQPAEFPIPTQNAARVFWWLNDSHDAAAATAWARAGLRAYFTRGLMLSQPEALKCAGRGQRPRRAAGRSGLGRYALEGAAEARQRRGHRCRRVRRALFRGRWRALLGQRPQGADRALAGAGTVLKIHRDSG